ncbi:M23 family metallopeptidase [Wielerella bovis]|uniref:M23 family metallopeptidase n=1 Tax=Wielerella bovis TaxID=2917790 RepID=UPI002018987A|nr:M23 family metallopeptidase [Wielerella bovis]ULJ59580.1 M23 family metallopeptidase [Wielerella bovis]
MKRLTLFSMLAAILLLSACANQTKTMTCQKPARGYYCVQSGDTLYRISQRFGVPVSDLQQWNKLSGSKIFSGQILQVSASARKRSAATRAAQVQQGQPKTQQTTAQVQKLQMPVNGFVIRTYDNNNFGIDIVAQRGMPVKAAADGVVIYAGEGVQGYGKLLLVRHSNTLLTAYGNNDSLLVPNGSRVVAGQTIATVGNSGRADGQNALHFEVRVNGKSVNPEPFFH